MREVSTSWLETYFEVVSAIAIERESDNPAPLVEQVNSTLGTGGFYELAVELTDKFEKANEGREWDGEYFEAVDEFMYKILNKLK